MLSTSRIIHGRVLTLVLTIVVLLMVPAGYYPAEANTRHTASGSLVLAGASWMGGQGVDIYSNGNRSTNVTGDNFHTTPSGVTVNTGWKWQCVELVNRLYARHGWIDTRWIGDARQFFDTAPAQLSKQVNGHISTIKAGDVVVLDDGDLGHVAIVDSVSGSEVNQNVRLVNQNTAEVYSTSRLGGGVLSSPYPGYTVRGIVQAPPSVATNDSLPPPAVVEHSGTMQVLVTGADGQVYGQYWAGTQWSGFASLGGNMASEPVAISFNNALQVFARGRDGLIYHGYADHNGWSGWGALGGPPMRGPPRVVQYGSELVVLGLAADGQPYKNSWQGQWTGFSTLGNFMASTPEPVIYDTQLHLVARGGDNALYHNVWNGSSWSGFGSLGGAVSGQPRPFTYNGQLEVWSGAVNGQLIKRVWNGQSWSEWSDMGGTFAGSPYLMQYNNNLQIFIRARNGAIYGRYWSNEAQAWSGWASLGGSFGSDPVALQYGGELSVMARTVTGGVYKNTFHPHTNWGGFTLL